MSWGTVIAWILVLGSLAKLCWLGIGVWQLRRYRKFAIPLSPIPDSIREANQIIGADALFCVSQHVTGPATLGHIDPIVLLPTSFQIAGRRGTTQHCLPRTAACAVEGTGW